MQTATNPASSITDSGGSRVSEYEAFGWKWLRTELLAHDGRVEWTWSRPVQEVTDPQGRGVSDWFAKFIDQEHPELRSLDDLLDGDDEDDGYQVW